MKKIFSAILLAFLAAGAFAKPNLLEKTQFGAAAIDDLSITLSSEELEIKETYDTTSIEVEIYCNNKKFAPDVSVSGSTLDIHGTAAKTFFSTPTGFSCTVIVYIPPKKDFGEINIKTSSGNITIDRTLSAEDEISVSASSGDITSSKGLFADSIKVSTSSGDIDLYNIDADDFSLHSTSGDLTVKKFTGATGSVHSTSGSIKADDFACEYAEFKSTSGSISVKKMDCDYFDVENTSGGITLELKNAPAATSSAECTSGDIDIYLPMRAKFTAEASCSSGTFRDKFNNNRMNPRDNYRMDYNGGGALLKLRTSSGNITLDY